MRQNMKLIKLYQDDLYCDIVKLTFYWRDKKGYWNVAHLRNVIKFCYMNGLSIGKNQLFSISPN